MTHDRLARLRRGAAAASFATATALVSHLVGGGEAPSALGVLAPWALSMLACVILAGLRHRLGQLIASVAISQLIFHRLFSLLSASAHVDMHLHHGERMAAAELPAGAVPHGGVVLQNGHVDVPMAAAHAVAGLVTVVVLRRAESLLEVLSAAAALLVSFLLPVVHAPAAPIRAPRPCVADALARVLDTTWATFPLRRRGPPPADLVHR